MFKVNNKDTRTMAMAGLLCTSYTRLNGSLTKNNSFSISKTPTGNVCSFLTRQVQMFINHQSLQDFRKITTVGNKVSLVLLGLIKKNVCDLLTIFSSFGEGNIFFQNKHCVKCGNFI